MKGQIKLDVLLRGGLSLIWEDPRLEDIPKIFDISLYFIYIVIYCLVFVYCLSIISPLLYRKGWLVVTTRSPLKLECMCKGKKAVSKARATTQKYF